MPSSGLGLWQRLGGEYRAVIAPLVPDRPAIAVEQHRVEAHPVKGRDVLRVEDLALFVGEVVAADVEVRCRTAADLTGPQEIEYAPVQLIQAHGTSSSGSGLRGLPGSGVFAVCHSREPGAALLLLSRRGGDVRTRAGSGRLPCRLSRGR